jgi:uncharacterized protein (TIGR02001 family)
VAAQGPKLHLGLVLAGMSIASQPVSAQLAGSLAVASDVRLRGISLNGGRPALTASLAYDHLSGFYFGAAATAGDTRRFGTQFLNGIVNLGYAGRLSPGVAWEAGLVDTRVRSNVYQPFAGGYTEVYLGISSERLSARLFYTPGFFQRGLDAAYFDFNGSFRPLPRVRAFGHFGVLVPLADGSDVVLPRARYDMRLGAAAMVGRGEVQLAWVRSGAGAAFLEPRRQTADALVVGASWSF